MTVREFALDTPSLAEADAFWAEYTARLLLYAVVERLERVPGLHVTAGEHAVRVRRAEPDEALGDIPHGLLLKLTALNRQGRLLVPLRDLPETLASLRPTAAVAAVRKAVRAAKGTSLLEDYFRARLGGDVQGVRRCKQDLREHLAAVDGNTAGQALARRTPPDGDDPLIG
jgi:enoyl-CoA hydratase/carnithine racemase